MVSRERMQLKTPTGINFKKLHTGVYYVQPRFLTVAKYSDEESNLGYRACLNRRGDRDKNKCNFFIFL